MKYRTGTWAANYGLATAGVDDAEGEVAIAHGTTKPEDTTSTTYNLSLEAATTPSSVTHKVGGNVDYCFDTATPISAGVFGEGEFNANNSSLNSWAVGAKVGFASKAPRTIWFKGETDVSLFFLVPCVFPF